MIDYQKWLFGLSVWIILWGMYLVFRPTIRFVRNAQRNKNFRKSL